MIASLVNQRTFVEILPVVDEALPQDPPVSSSPCSVSVNHGYAVGDEVDFAASVRATLNNNQPLGPALTVTIA
jgi:hypothetical protein